MIDNEDLYIEKKQKVWDIIRKNENHHYLKTMSNFPKLNVAICGYIWYNRNMEGQYLESQCFQIQEYDHLLSEQICPDRQQDHY